MNFSSKSLLLVTSLYTLGCATAAAQEKPDSMQSSGKRFNIHFQTTYIYQYKPEFDAAYTGPNSLITKEEKQNSITATLYLGAKLWKGAELYVNPEMAGGSGLSGAFGMGAATNGETFRVGNPEPTLYLGRGYLSQTIGLGKKHANVEETANELGGSKPANYIKLLLGKICIGDIFDNNLYANSPRTQFLNWCLMNNGAWDYAANTRGYTYAFAAIVQHNSMTYKAALAMLPKVANGPDLNTDLSKSYSINAEVDRAYTISGKTGNIRLLGYINNTHLGSYAEAINHPDSGNIPVISNHEAYGRTKVGAALNMDQQLSSTLGIFARLGWNDGKNETWAFTEVDRTVSAGLALNGAKWKRKDDNLSLGVVVNGLSADHRDYLGAGGLGFQLGDGRISYANEMAAEIYYSYKPTSSGIWITGDYQFVLNPGYNSDRGPVNVLSLRLHVEL